LAEALAQNRAILQYFSGILDFNLRSRPATVYLCTAALRIGSFLAMHYKYNYNRVRPSRLSPGLMPPIEPPDHASFPSGHATQARLIALCLEAVMPDSIIPVVGGVKHRIKDPCGRWQIALPVTAKCWGCTIAPIPSPARRSPTGPST
jgi:hypothetical protein